MARTDEDVLHHIEYGLAMVTQDRRPVFSGPRKDDLVQALRKESVERGWVLTDVRVEPARL
ncbi:MAG: hypothetical protein WCI75_19140, partial [candidate division NC10 bacterium]